MVAMVVKLLENVSAPVFSIGLWPPSTGNRERHPKIEEGP